MSRTVWQSHRDVHQKMKPTCWHQMDASASCFFLQNHTDGRQIHPPILMHRTSWQSHRDVHLNRIRLRPSRQKRVKRHIYQDHIRDYFHEMALIRLPCHQIWTTFHVILQLMWDVMLDPDEQAHK
jgi:hypothetical protein